MHIRCDCGAFRAELSGLPRNSPGRLVCYCDDCQLYLEKIKREDLLDAFGGTEIIPVYPKEFEILQGEEHLQCNRLTEKGLNRWSAQCCNSPIGNIMEKFPWIGVFHSAYKAEDLQALEKLGPVKSRIQGRYAKATPPFPVSEKMKLRDTFVVLPFIAKGFLLGKYKGSWFFKEDGVTPKKEVHLLT